MSRIGIALVPMHATPADQPPPLTGWRWLTTWVLEWPVVVAALLAAGLYLWGVVVLHRRGVPWPVGRTVSFVVGGVGTVVVATLSALGAYDTVLLSVHMVQHMMLAMVAPIFAALGAPVTLLLRAGPLPVRRGLPRVLHHPVVRVLTHPLLALALYIANPFVLYFSGLYEVTLRSVFWHDFMHVHFLLSGALFFWPLIGIDPMPHRISYPFRVLMLFVTLPFHAFLGVGIMGAERLVAEDWYLSFERDWGPSLADDQYLAGGLLWGSGDIFGLVVMAALFVQWFRSSQREAVREDRRLDRLEAQQARGERQARLAREGQPVPHGAGPVPADGEEFGTGSPRR